MALELLNPSDFYEYAGISAEDVNEKFVEKIIESTNKAIEKRLGGLFSLTPDTTKRYYMRNAPSIVVIGTWQPDDLVVKYGTDSYDELSELTLHKDYRVINSGSNGWEQSDVVAAIRLFNRFVSTNAFIEVSGTYGYSEGVPDDLMLDTELYEIIRRAVYSAEIDAETGGRGPVSSTSIDKVRISFDTSSSGYMSTSSAIAAINAKLDEVARGYELDPGMLATVIG